MPRLRLLLLPVFLMLAVQVCAQRVGVALSGGGAKGLYHIGVLMALEDNGVPVDYISGTSMGAIVGGLYAAGYSPRRMKEEFCSEKIGYWLTGRIESRYAYYFKQMRRNAAMITIRPEEGFFRKKARRMPSLVPTSQLDMAFVEYFAGASVACGGDFDRLMIPFRCVVTEAVSRTGIICRDGDLGMAVRKSMTVPLVFRPIKTDTTLYYDGGISNNFPWQVLEQDFRPDVIIGSKCVEGDRMPDRNGFMDQLFDLAMMHTDYELPPEKGIMISRVFEDVTILDFDKAEWIIRCGYEDAEKMMPEIKRRVKRVLTPREAQKRRREFRADCPLLLFDDYSIEGLNRQQTAYVRRLLRLDRPDRLGMLYGFEQFRSEYFKLLSEGQMISDYPEVAYDTLSHRFALKMELSARPSFKLMFGGNVSSTALNQAYIGMQYKAIGRAAQQYDLDLYLSPFYSSPSFAARVDFFAGIPMFVEAGFTGNYYNYFRSNYGFLTKGNDLTYSKYHDTYVHLSYGMPINRHSVLFMQANAGRDAYRYYQRTGYEDSDPMDRTRFDFRGVRLALERDDLNYIMFPNRGIKQSVSVAYLSGTEHFRPGASGLDLGQGPGTYERHWFAARFTRTHYFPVRPVKWFSFGYTVDALLSTHPDFSNDYATNITSPAFTPTPHSHIVYMKEYRADSYAAAGLMPAFEFMPKLYLQLSAYAFLPWKYNHTTGEGIRQTLRYVFDASLVYQTVVGAVSLSLSKYDVRRNNWFITFNFGYAVFNKKGLYY